MRSLHPQSLRSRHGQAGRCKGRACEAIVLAAAMVAVAPLAASAQSGVASAPGGGRDSAINYGNARPMGLPMSSVAPPALLDVLLSGQAARADQGVPSVTPGEVGNGQMSPVRLAAAKSLEPGDGVAPQEFGTSGQPFTTSRVNATDNVTSKYYPYRAAGKLFFNSGATTFVCSASLIKRGVVVTAAHCVTDFGTKTFYTNWRYVPAYNNGTAPYGTWTAKSATVLTSYFNGTDKCSEKGVVCENDVAVITLNAQGGAYPGTKTGFLGYGVDGYSYNGSGQVLISQLGYPVALDDGALMERTDSQGITSASMSNNTIIGSLQTGGSSGGPWVVNLGIAPTLAGTSFGTDASHNIVVGVTSWGYINTAVKQEGASRFTKSNVPVLLKAACAATPAACS